MVSVCEKMIHHFIFTHIHTNQSKGEKGEAYSLTNIYIHVITKIPSYMKLKWMIGQIQIKNNLHKIATIIATLSNWNFIVCWNRIIDFFLQCSKTINKTHTDEEGSLSYIPIIIISGAGLYHALYKQKCWIVIEF